MKKTLKEVAYDYVSEKISSREYLPGMRLSEVAVAKEIGVSPTPLREAYSQLVSEGILEHVPNSGICVKNIEKKEIFDLYELREAVETFCAAKATQLMNKAQTDRIEEFLNMQKKMAQQLLDSGEEFLTKEMQIEYLKADLAFHRLIIESSENETFKKIMQQYQALSKLLKVNIHRHTFKQIETTLDHHSKIIKYIKKHDPEKSAFWMKKHIQFSRKTILEEISDSQTE
ncbi:MAG: GntR family transcriptional regulator [Verrucomicrobiota bacterium]|nr:GntR family transcriptional regulator [Verrucomicrobiota bacterium]